MVFIAGISVKNANLFFNSKTSEDYQWLKELMIKNHKKPQLTKKEFDNLPDDKKEFLNLRWGEIFNIAQSEWKAIKKFESNKKESIIDCELCGHKELDLISIIENMENGNRFIVGSTCILRFDKINNNNASDYNAYKKQKKIDERKLSNEEFFESKYKGIIRSIKNFINVRHDNTLIMSDEIENEYKRLDIILNSDYKEEAIKSNKNKIDLRKIEYIYNSINQFLLDINKYKNDSQNNKWGINSKIAQWCYENGNEQLFKLLKYKGEIDYYTVDQIREPNYLNKVIGLFKPLIEQSNMKLANYGRIDVAFNISINKRKNIFLDVKSIDLIKLKKNYLFNKEFSTISLDEILAIGNVSYKSLPEAFNYICRDGRFFKDYSKYFDEIGINELAFLNKQNHKIYLVDYKKLINKFKAYVYFDSLVNDNVENVKKYIADEAQVYSESDYKEHLKNIGISI